MQKIKKYSEFLSEHKLQSIEISSKISSLFNELERNYLNFPSHSDVIQRDINFIEEKRRWPNFVNTAELNKIITEKGKLYMKFLKSGDIFEILIDFKVEYKGVENFDDNDSNYHYQQSDDKGNTRCGVALEKLKINRLRIKSDFLNFDGVKMLPDLNKTILKFMLNILKSEFDIISDESLIIRQL